MLADAKGMISDLVVEENGMLTVDESGIPNRILSVYPSRYAVVLNTLEEIAG